MDIHDKGENSARQQLVQDIAEATALLPLLSVAIGRQLEAAGLPASDQGGKGALRICDLAQLLGVSRDSVERRIATEEIHTCPGFPARIPLAEAARILRLE